MPTPSEGFDFMTFVGPPPEGPICDFCSYPHVTWTYPCRDHRRATTRNIAVGIEADGSSEVVSDLTLDGIQHGGWAACNVCHAFIERGDRIRLAKRSARKLIDKLARQRPPIIYPYENAVRTVREFHDDFWANREGPAVKHEGQPRKDPTR